MDEIPEQQERQESPAVSDDDVDSLGKQIKRTSYMYLPTLVLGCLIGWLKTNLRRRFLVLNGENYPIIFWL